MWLSRHLATIGLKTALLRYQTLKAYHNFAWHLDPFMHCICQKRILDIQGVSCSKPRKIAVVRDSRRVEKAYQNSCRGCSRSRLPAAVVESLDIVDVLQIVRNLVHNAGFLHTVSDRTFARRVSEEKWRKGIVKPQISNFQRASARTVYIYHLAHVI